MHMFAQEEPFKNIMYHFSRLAPPPAPPPTQKIRKKTFKNIMYHFSSSSRLGAPHTRNDMRNEDLKELFFFSLSCNPKSSPLNKSPSLQHVCVQKARKSSQPMARLTFSMQDPCSF